MRNLGLKLLGVMVLATGALYTLKIGRRDRGLDAVASSSQQYWTADFRNVTRHVIAGRVWLCGELSRPGAAGYVHFVVVSGGDVPVIEGHDSPEILDYAQAHYCI